MTAAVLPLSSSLKVLLVDDNPDDVARFQRLFRHEGWQISSATNGEECLRALGSTQPNVIVLDFLLGDTLGTDVLRRIREMGIQTPVILHSGTPNALASQGGLPADAAGFVSKNSSEYARQIVDLVRRTSPAPAPTGAEGGLPVTTVEEILSSLVKPHTEFVCAGLAYDRGANISAHITFARNAPMTSVETLARLAKSGPAFDASLREAQAEMLTVEFGRARACLASVPGIGTLFAATAGPDAIPPVGTDAVKAAAAAFAALADSREKDTIN